MHLITLHVVAVVLGRYSEWDLQRVAHEVTMDDSGLCLRLFDHWENVSATMAGYVVGFKVEPFKAGASGSIFRGTIWF